MHLGGLSVLQDASLPTQASTCLARVKDAIHQACQGQCNPLHNHRSESQRTAASNRNLPNRAANIHVCRRVANSNFCTDHQTSHRGGKRCPRLRPSLLVQVLVRAPRTTKHYQCVCVCMCFCVCLSVRVHISCTARIASNFVMTRCLAFLVAPSWSTSRACRGTCQMRDKNRSARVGAWHAHRLCQPHLW